MPTEDFGLCPYCQGVKIRPHCRDEHSSPTCDLLICEEPIELNGNQTTCSSVFARDRSRSYDGRKKSQRP